MPDSLEDRTNEDTTVGEAILDAVPTTFSFKKLKRLSGVFEEAQEKRQQYSDLLNTNPTALKAAIKAHSKEVGFDKNLKELEEEYPDLYNSKNYQLLAQIGNWIVSHEHGRDESDYHAALRDKSGALLKDAPENLNRILIKTTDKEKIKGLVDKYGKFAEDHLEYQNQLDLLQKWGLQTQEGSEARKTVRSRFKESHKALYNGFEDLVEQIVDALSLDFRHYMEDAKKTGEKLAENASKHGEYLVEAAGHRNLTRYAQAALYNELPSEVPMGLQQAA